MPWGQYFRSGLQYFWKIHSIKQGFLLNRGFKEQKQSFRHFYCLKLGFLLNRGFTVFIKTKEKHAGQRLNFSSTGSTSCQLACIRNYIAVEASPYKCGKMPCPKWTLQDSKCYMCDKKCDQMHSLKDPKAEDLVSKALQCTCPQVVPSGEYGFLVKKVTFKSRQQI